MISRITVRNARILGLWKWNGVYKNADTGRRGSWCTYLVIYMSYFKLRKTSTKQKWVVKAIVGTVDFLLLFFLKWRKLITEFHGSVGNGVHSVWITLFTVMQSGRECYLQFHPRILNLIIADMENRSVQGCVCVCCILLFNQCSA